MVNNLIAMLKVQDFAFLTAVLGIIVTSLIQWLSKKYSPWTWIFEQLGRLLNKETMEKLEEIDARVGVLEKDNKRQDEEKYLERAKAARRRIIRFADEIRANGDNQIHSKEMFDDILSDISYYQNYCEEHPNFKNEKARMAITFTEESYRVACVNNDFL